jgi:hypothetical protein
MQIISFDAEYQGNEGKTTRERNSRKEVLTIAH